MLGNLTFQSWCLLTSHYETFKLLCFIPTMILLVKAMRLRLPESISIRLCVVQKLRTNSCESEKLNVETLKCQSTDSTMDVKDQVMTICLFAQDSDLQAIIQDASQLLEQPESRKDASAVPLAVDLMVATLAFWEECFPGKTKVDLAR